MPKIKKKIEFSEKDIKELIAEKYDLNLDTVSINISKYEGNVREASSTTIYVEGEENKVV